MTQSKFSLCPTLKTLTFALAGLQGTDGWRGHGCISRLALISWHLLKHTDLMQWEMLSSLLWQLFMAYQSRRAYCVCMRLNILVSYPKTLNWSHFLVHETWEIERRSNKQQDLDYYHHRKLHTSQHFCETWHFDVTCASFSVVIFTFF